MLVKHLASVIFPELIFRIPTTEKKIFLTFDDGPSPEITPWVLSTLKKHNATATFFCVGEKVEKYPEIFSEVIQQGHAIGNHTMHHLNGWKVSSEKYLRDIKQCAEALRLFQVQTNFLRPPYGKLTPSQYSSLKKNHHIIMWDVLSKDYDETISTEKCLQSVITKSKPGSVIVFHDSAKAEKNIKYALPRALEYFSDNKFAFCPLAN